MSSSVLGPSDGRPPRKSITHAWRSSVARWLRAWVRRSARQSPARRPGDPEFAELIDRLHQASPEVRSWWPRHDVLPVAGGVKRLHHPAVGDVTFQHVVLQVADRPEQTLVSFTSADAAEEVLARLASGIQ